MKTNVKAPDTRLDKSARLAGGFGVYAAKQDAEALLRRSVMANLLWEDLFYEDGKSVVDNIKSYLPSVDPQTCFDIAVEARTKQKLRHVPLLIAREMARIPSHKGLVGKLLPQIILRADELSEYLALYWKDGKQPISKQTKFGLQAAFQNFDAYQLAKWNRDSTIRLRDVMFLVHPKPGQKEDLFKKLADDSLEPPDTWEVGLSAGKDKVETFTRLINEKKLGALAFLRNLRLMKEVGVTNETIATGFQTINPRWLLPLNYFAANKYAPDWSREIEDLMYRALYTAPKLKGHTVFVVDVSGSMQQPVSNKSDLNRLDVASIMATLATEMCEHISIYVTAGNDSSRVHSTAKVKPYRGFALAELITASLRSMSGGGIFTRQCLEYIHKDINFVPDRIIVFSDSQDCDLPERSVPKPFGKYNYIVDVSSHQHGINYKGVWTAEISGWSEHFLTYIAAYEGADIPQQDTEE